MAGSVGLEVEGSLALLTLRQPEKFNAMSCGMWQALRRAVQELAPRGDIRCIVLRGEGAHFCAGGDIAEYPDFRFDETRLRLFHEEEVWGALQALLDCDIPLVAAIRGNCMGAGLEIASCCDIRIAAGTARFGAPIARLGFPMAPRELQLVLGQAGALAVREMLLEAAVWDAPRMLQQGFLNRVVEDTQLDDHALQTAQRIVALAPAAARQNKRTLRALGPAGAGAGPAALHTLLDTAYAYADSAEHREGIGAFLAKRAPEF